MRTNLSLDEFSENTATSPHINLLVVRHPENYLAHNTAKQHAALKHCSAHSNTAARTQTRQCALQHCSGKTLQRALSAHTTRGVTQTAHHMRTRSICQD